MIKYTPAKLSWEVLNDRMIAFIINWSMIQGLISTIFNYHSVFNKIIMSRLYRAVFVVIVLYVIYTVFYKKVSRRALLLIIFCFAVFAVSIGLNIRTLADDFSPIIRDYIFAILCFLAMTKISSIVDFLECLKKYIWLSSIYSIYAILYFQIIYKYSMSFSYQIALPTIMAMLFLLKNRKYQYIPCIMINIFALLYCGSRGVFLCLVIAVLIYALKFCNSKKFVYITVGLTIIGLLYVGFGDVICPIIKNRFMYSRTYILLSQGRLFSFSTRIPYYSNVLSAFKESPFSIHGFYADRVLLYNTMSPEQTLNASVYGMYVHNFFLEILYQFGIWAVIILVLLIVNSFKAFRYSIKSEISSFILLYIIFLSYAAGQLLVSSSYLSSPSFAIFIGFNIYVLDYMDKERNEKKHESFIVAENY